MGTFGTGEGVESAQRADNSFRTSRQRVIHARSKLAPSSRSCVRATVLPGGPECGWRSSPWLRLPRKGEEVAEEAEEEESLGKQELQLPVGPRLGSGQVLQLQLWSQSPHMVQECLVSLHAFPGRLSLVSDGLRIR